MRKVWALLVCLFFSFCDLRAQTDSALIVQPPVEETYESDNRNPVEDQVAEEKPDIQSDTTLSISSRIIIPDTIRAWKNSSQFSYMLKIDSILRKLNGSKEKNDAGSIRDRGNARKNFRISPVAGGILWSLAGLLVLFVLYNVFMTKGIFAKSNRRSRVKIHERDTTGMEIIPEGNYQDLIANAEKEENYRLAIRYHFLSVLDRLATKELLHPEKGKTNAAYLRELPVEMRREFSALVNIYEYAWYGHITVANHRYGEIAEQFNRFGS